MLFLLALGAALLAVPLFIVVAVKLVLIVLPGRRDDWFVELLRWSAVMAAVIVVGLYSMGFGLVRISAHESESGASSAPSPSCREVGAATLERVTGYRPSYLPLGFDCVLDDGTTYPSSSLYSRLNELIAVLGVSAGALVVASGYVVEWRVRRQVDTKLSS